MSQLGIWMALMNISSKRSNNDQKVGNEQKIDAFSLRLATEFCSGLSNEKETREEARRFVEEMGEYIFGKSVDAESAIEEMASIAKGLDPLVGAELLLAVHYTGRASELTSADFLESLKALDNHIASSLLYEMQITGNVSLLSDNRMFNSEAANFFNALGYEAASEWFYSIAKTGDIENLTSSAVLNEKILSVINEDSRISSELSYAIGETGRVDALTDGRFLDALKGLEPVMAAELLSAVWCIGDGVDLASAEVVAKLGSADADVWREMARVNASFAEQGNRIIISNFGDGHDRGSKMLMRDLISQGFDVIYVGEMQDYREIARIAQAEKVSAVGFGLMGDGHSEIVANTLNELKVLGLNGVQVFGGGFVEAKTIAKFEDSGIRFFAPGAKTDDVGLFLKGAHAQAGYLEYDSKGLLHGGSGTEILSGPGLGANMDKARPALQVQLLGADYTISQQNYWIKTQQAVLPYPASFQDMPAQGKKESEREEQRSELSDIEDYDVELYLLNWMKRSEKIKQYGMKPRARTLPQIPNQDILIPRTRKTPIEPIRMNSNRERVMLATQNSIHNHSSKSAKIGVKRKGKYLADGIGERDKHKIDLTMITYDNATVMPKIKLRMLQSAEMPLTFGRKTANKANLDSQATNLTKKPRTVGDTARKGTDINETRAGKFMTAAQFMIGNLEARGSVTKKESKVTTKINLPKELSSASEKDGFEVKIEREKKFLVEPDRVPDLKEYNHALFTQSYAKDAHTGNWVRARKVDFGDRSEYFATIKKFVPDGSKAYERIEAERAITKEQFEMVNRLADGKTVTKTRYWIPYEGRIIDFDIYHDAVGSRKLSGLMTAEVEFDNMEDLSKFVAPEWFGKEVSADNRYRSRKLARRGKPMVEEVRSVLRR